MTGLIAVRGDPWWWPLLGPIDPERAALVVIDLQRDFVDPAGWFASLGFDVASTSAVLPVVTGLLDYARQVPGLRVIHTRQGNLSDLSDLPPFRFEQGRRHGRPIGADGPLGRGLVRGEPGWMTEPSVAPDGDEWIVDKPGYSAFRGTDLDDRLRSAGITSLVLSGVTANVCVLATLYDAVDLGYDCLTVVDAIAAASPEMTARVVELIGYQGGLFGSTATSSAVRAALLEVMA